MWSVLCAWQHKVIIIAYNACHSINYLQDPVQETDSGLHPFQSWHEQLQWCVCTLENLGIVTADVWTQTVDQLHGHCGYHMYKNKPTQFHPQTAFLNVTQSSTDEANNEKDTYTLMENCTQSAKSNLWNFTLNSVFNYFQRKAVCGEVLDHKYMNRFVTRRNCMVVSW